MLLPLYSLLSPHFHLIPPEAAQMALRCWCWCQLTIYASKPPYLKSNFSFHSSPIMKQRGASIQYDFITSMFSPHLDWSLVATRDAQPAPPRRSPKSIDKNTSTRPNQPKSRLLCKNSPTCLAFLPTKCLAPCIPDETKKNCSDSEAFQDHCLIFQL